MSRHLPTASRDRPLVSATVMLRAAWATGRDCWQPSSGSSGRRPFQQFGRQSAVGCRPFWPSQTDPRSAFGASENLPPEGASEAAVYCATRGATEKVAEFPKGQGLAADYFHAALLLDRKRDVQEAFRTGQLRVIAANRVFIPELSAPEMAVSQVEGWILGVPWAPTKKAKPTAKPTAKVGRSSSGGKTTKASYVNKNGQEVLHATDLPGNDHSQVIHVLRCGNCGHRYGANGSDIWQRKCLDCGGGATGLAF